MPDFDTFWENGFFRIPDREEEYTLFSDYREDPLTQKLKSPSGRFELYSEKIEKFG